MSQVSKQVEWCLRKAKKEIEECKKNKRGLKHRGLLKVKPNIDKAKSHILKAEHNIKAIEYFNKGDFSDWSITAGFYCIYHCFLAIAMKFGYESRNQNCTIALIESLIKEGDIGLDTRFIDLLKYEDSQERHESSVIELREEYTYGIATSVKKSEISGLLNNCREMIDATKEIVLK